MLVIVGAAIYWAWITFEDRRLEASSAVTRTWTSTTIPVRQKESSLRASVKTRCAAARLYYVLTVERNDKPSRVEGSPSNVTTFEDLAGRISEYSIQFMDSDGFRVYEIEVKRNTLSWTVGKDGIPEGLEANGANFCDAREYRRVTQVIVGWKQSSTP
jgi:hypothetical protein